MKSLNGSELAGFIKERQAHEVRGLSKAPHLLIIRDSDNPVITKYVNLKIKYGEDIGVKVTDYFAKSTDDIRDAILSANDNPDINGIILQLPIIDRDQTDAITSLIAPEKDVDGLANDYQKYLPKDDPEPKDDKKSDKKDRPIIFDSATATAILWLLTGYDVDLQHKSIALVGRGKLVGAPLYKMFTDSGYNVELFHRGSDMSKIRNYDIIITATGVPGLITNDLVKPGAVIVDAGTASEKGVLLGDIADEVRNRTDLAAITPKLGGVGPLTVTCLFDHVIQAAK